MTWNDLLSTEERHSDKRLLCENDRECERLEILERERERERENTVNKTLSTKLY